MNREDLYRAVGEIDDGILERSESAANGRGEKSGWLKWGAAAACLCLVILGAAMRERPMTHTDEGTGITVSEEGVTIPPIRVTLSKDGSQTASLAARSFIYQGRCYMEYKRHWDAGDIIGGYLGTVTGMIDEWTPEDGYVDFAGSAEGDIYSVKGYDTSFMLCIKKSARVADLYICNNGITLKYGSELYEDRLHLSGNVESVRYQSCGPEGSGGDECYQMNSVHDVISDLIRDMNAGQFIPDYAVLLEEGRAYVSDTELYFLSFQMKDGTIVDLGLYENGYVRFPGVWGICVQVQEKTFRALLDVLDHHTDSARARYSGPRWAGP